MTKQYYLHDGTTLQGPFSFDVLAGKNISPDAHVWYEGLDEWTKAGELEELKALFSDSPFPGAIQPAAPVTAQEQPGQMPELPGRKDKKRSLKMLWVVLLVAAIAATGLYYANRTDTEPVMQASYEEKVSAIAEIEHSMPDDFLSVQGEFTEDLPDNKLEVRGAITNKATVASYKDAVIRVTFYDKAIRELGSHEYTVREHFGAHSITPFEFKTDDYGAVETVRLSLVDAVAE